MKEKVGHVWALREGRKVVHPRAPLRVATSLNMATRYLHLS